MAIFPKNKLVNCSNKDVSDKIGLPNEIWVEIMWKLSIKPLHVCKSVSKTWYANVAYILSCQKGIDRPPCGIVFNYWHNLTDGDEPIKGEHKLGYLSLADYKTTQFPSSYPPLPHPECGGIIHMTEHLKTLNNYQPLPESNSAIIHMTGGNGSGHGLLSSLGGLTLDFSYLTHGHDLKLPNVWNMHRGLVLIRLQDVLNYRYLVYNPATREKFALPSGPASATRRAPTFIINLSDCLLSAQCNFRVVRICREHGRRFSEVYSSQKNQWFQTQLHLNRATCLATWDCINSVILDNNTLFFMTNRSIVRLKLLSNEQTSADILHLPQPVQKSGECTRLFESQGCLHLSHSKFSNKLWIWKHNGRSLDSQAWIPQLIFQPSGMSLCQPVADKYLRQFSSAHSRAVVMFTRPEAPGPIVFIYIKPSIFVFDLLNDTVEKIADLPEGKDAYVGYAFVYTPCLASFECLKHQNQQT